MENSQVNVSDKDENRFHFDTKKWGATFTGEWLFRYPIYGAFILDLNQLNPEAQHVKADEGMALAPAEETIHRILAMDALAKEKGITVSEEEFEKFCKDYIVDTENTEAVALARYCCMEDKLLRTYLPIPYMPLQELSWKTNQSVIANDPEMKAPAQGILIPANHEELKKFDFVTLAIRIEASSGEAWFEEDDVLLLFGFGTLGSELEKELEGKKAGDTVTVELKELSDGYYSCFKGEGTIKVSVKDIQMRQGGDSLSHYGGNGTASLGWYYSDSLFSSGNNMLVPCYIIPEGYNR